ncbi:SMI1/KNR4 family protein [Methylobacterium sp. 88A]|uniref:SMI1/KNR4 family protein n=1 Tax=Methylobacterium sp. 88A TaxID=1131813 RepID=UPI00036DAB53|nr:SMI1/KNR4 family protein [Methylobacterium sp. 88A]
MTNITMHEALRSLLDLPDEMGRPPKPVTPKDIEDFELSENVRMPEDLKAFWLTYGARQLGSKSIFCFKAKTTFANEKKKRIDVGAIGGPHALAETRQRYLDPLYGNSGPRLPEALYPLTFDDGYGHCLIDLTPEHHGRILYIVIKAKTFGARGYDWNSVGVVENSFADFLASLTPDYL